MSGSSSNVDEAHRGGTLEEMSARGGTKIPRESGTQPVAHSDAAERTVRGGGFVDNVKAMPDSAADDSGLTGEVRTGLGDLLPPGVEAKRINMDTTGGKEIGGSMGHHTKKSDEAGALGRRGRARDDRARKDVERELDEHFD